MLIVRGEIVAVAGQVVELEMHEESFEATHCSENIVVSASEVQEYYSVSRPSVLYASSR